ncbi:Rpn family recombination-promoting nuclease/putative transposase [uncultured Phascolarctobacterium sp.]|uniref:Rpn family recombination-promoting nuclease/putative transposase n=1 Tax=uncultured Phascolarctobacterium sp. TaxID=512296 RepID=UPI002604D9D2|nr:Rpn family recombination-promoting nuclease/putative transposase [uncultured Phascolarctobacterium sp.]
MPINYFIDIEQIVKTLCMMNNKFMNAMLHDNIPATQKMLRVIMKNDKIKVISVCVQNFIQNLFGHSAQLDILAEDENGRRFNVEIQRADEGAPAKRARFYSSSLDTVFLKAGHDYEELPETYVIFITENDVLQRNLPIYNIDRYIGQNMELFKDGSHIIYVNSQIQDDTPLGKLMQDMYCTDPAKLNYKEFAPQMEFLKHSKDGEGEMRDLFEEYAHQVGQQIGQQLGQKIGQQLGQEIGEKIAKEKVKEATKKATMKAAKTTKKKTLKDMALKMLKRGDSVEDVAEITSLPPESVRALQASM